MTNSVFSPPDVMRFVPPDYPIHKLIVAALPPVKTFAPGSAEQKMADFITAWSQANWDGMYACVLNFVGRAEFNREIREIYSKMALVTCENIRTRPIFGLDREIAIEVTFEANLFDSLVNEEFSSTGLSPGEFSFLLIRERNGVPSTHGIWGIAPKSYRFLRPGDPQITAQSLFDSLASRDSRE